MRMFAEAGAAAKLAAAQAQAQAQSIVPPPSRQISVESGLRKYGPKTKVVLPLPPVDAVEDEILYSGEGLSRKMSARMIAAQSTPLPPSRQPSLESSHLKFAMLTGGAPVEPMPEFQPPSRRGTPGPGPIRPTTPQLSTSTISAPSATRKASVESSLRRPITPQSGLGYSSTGHSSSDLHLPLSSETRPPTARDAPPPSSYHGVPGARSPAPRPTPLHSHTSPNPSASTESFRSFGSTSDILQGGSTLRSPKADLRRWAAKHAAEQVSKPTRRLAHKRVPT